MASLYVGIAQRNLPSVYHSQLMAEELGLRSATAPRAQEVHWLWVPGLHTSKFVQSNTSEYQLPYQFIPTGQTALWLGMRYKEVTMAQRLSPSPSSGKVRFSLPDRLPSWGTRVLNHIRAILLVGRLPLLWTSVLAESALLLVALVPPSVWANYGYPAGPIPNSLAPVVAGAFYLLPLLTGMLCRRWHVAIILATFPAWLDLGVFAIAAAKRIGPFYLVQDPHTVNTVSTLELFGILGLLGWLGRSWLLGLLVSGTNEP